MFFVLSKIFAFLLIPFNWILLLFVIYLIVKNKTIKKRLLIGIVSIFIIFSNPFLFKTIVLNWQIKQSQLQQGKQYEAGILLGGMVSFDKDNKGHFGATADRFIQTEKLYHQGIIKRIVVTGGSGSLMQNEPVEADFIVQELIASGVKETDIIRENKSKNTFENAVFTKQILDSLKLQPPYVLISSASHLNRAIKVFTKANLAVVAYPSAFEVIETKMSFIDALIPDITQLIYWKYIIKEMIGVLVYSLTGKA